MCCCCYWSCCRRRSASSFALSTLVVCFHPGLIHDYYVFMFARRQQKKLRPGWQSPSGNTKLPQIFTKWQRSWRRQEKNNFKAFGQRDLFYSRDFCCLSPYTRIVPWCGIMSVTFSHNLNTVNKNTAFGVIGCRWCISWTCVRSWHVEMDEIECNQWIRFYWTRNVWPIKSHGVLYRIFSTDSFMVDSRSYQRH